MGHGLAQFQRPQVGRIAAMAVRDIWYDRGLIHRRGTGSRAPCPVARIHMIDFATGGGRWLGAGCDRDGAAGGGAIGIAERQAHLLGRAFLKIEHRAGEHVGGLEIEDPVALIDALAGHPQQGDAVFPGGLALPAVGMSTLALRLSSPRPAIRNPD